MEYKKSITALSLTIALLAISAASIGIFSSSGPGPCSIETVRGTTVTVYGRGFYQHMSADVAPQGIAQDYVTLFVAAPLLILSLFWTHKGSLRGRFVIKEFRYEYA